MSIQTSIRRACLALALLLPASAALAHHGWSWTDDGFFELEGVVDVDLYSSPRQFCAFR